MITKGLSIKTDIISTWTINCLYTVMMIETKTLEKLRSIKNSSNATKAERNRAHALLLLNKGKSKSELSEIFEVSIRTIYNWINDFKADGIKSLAIQKGRAWKKESSK